MQHKCKMLAVEKYTSRLFHKSQHVCPKGHLQAENISHLHTYVQCFMFYVRKSNFSTGRWNPEIEFAPTTRPTISETKKNLFRVSHFSTKACLFIKLCYISENLAVSKWTRRITWPNAKRDVQHQLQFSPREEFFCYDLWGKPNDNLQPTQTETGPTQVVGIVKNVFVQWRVRCMCVWVDGKSALSTFKTKLLHFWPPHATMKACGGRMSGGGDADIKHHNTVRFQFT